MHKKPTYLVRGAPSPIRKYRMATAYRAAPLDPLDEPLKEHAGGRCGHPARSAGGNPVDSWRPVIRLLVSVHLVLRPPCRCAAHLMADKIP